MLFSIFITALIPLFLAPVWTHELFKSSFEKQKNIIALDNAAILLGREIENCSLLLKRQIPF